MKRLGLALFCLFAIAFAQDTVWVRRYDLGSAEELIGIFRKNEWIVGVGYYMDPEDYDDEALIVLFNQSGETLRTAKIDLGADEQLIDVFVDEEKNTYVAGVGEPYERLFLRPLELLRGPRFQQIYCIIAKFDSLGNMKWAAVDSPYAALGVVVDTLGNCYATGCYGELFFSDFAVAKFLPDGDTAWTRRFDYNFVDIFYRPALDQKGNLIVPGFTSDFQNFRGVVMKISPAGETLWTRVFDNAPNVVFASAYCDQNGNSYVTGACGDENNTDVFVVKLDSAGTLVWQQIFDTTYDDEGLGIAGDTSGNIYVAGFESGGNCLLLKIDAQTGLLIWSVVYNPTGYAYFNDVCLDEAANPIACGSVDNPENRYDLLLAKFSPVTGIAEKRKSVFGHRSSVIFLPGKLIFDAGVAGRYQFEIFDLLGKRVSGKIERELNLGRNYIPLNPLASGVYIIRTAGPGQRTETYKGIMAK